MPPPGGLQLGKGVQVSEESRWGAKSGVTMKAAKEPEFRIWCEQCYIRIAPNEERITNSGKIYHAQCYSKLVATGSVEKKTRHATRRVSE
jgi:hypothetical protein